MNIIEAKDLKMYFPIPSNRKVIVRAVDGVSFGIPAGRTFGLVGESGCGKSTTARMLIKLYTPTAGQILFNGEDITRAKGEALKQVRRNIQMVFQDPYASLHPRMTVAATVTDPMRIYKTGTEQAMNKRLNELMELVGLDPRFTKRYPHEFSGGQRQRIGIARALALNPQLVILDEPVSALDVSVQSQILNLMKSLQKELNLTYLFISHNLGVIDYMCDDIAVMYLGHIVEQASRQELFGAPRHPYTLALLNAVPEINLNQRKERPILGGDIPSPTAPPPGCTFHTRCPLATDICRRQAPPARAISDSHQVYCWHAK